jgi:ankyrin repeat protein
MNSNGLLLVSSEGELHVREGEIEKYREYLENQPSSVKSLDMRNSSLKIMPVFICELNNLLSLDLRENLLETLPSSISCLQSLQILKLDYNHLKVIPVELFELENMRNFSASHNQIEILGKGVKKWKKLIFLDLSYNILLEIPKAIGKLRNLNLLSIQNNSFSSLPPVIHKLESLKQLSLDWFRYTQPGLPTTLKGPNGEILIKSLQNLSQLHHSSNNSENITIIKLLSYFTDFPAFSLERCGFGPISLLHKASLNNDLGVVSGLLEAGCDIDLLDSEGLSAFVISIRDGFTGISKLLLNKGCNVNIGGGIYGSALHLAVAKNDVELVKELVEKSCRLDQKNCDGNTIMHILMINFNKHKTTSQEIGEILIRAGTDVNSLNRDNWAPLHIASRKAQNSAISWICKVNFSKLSKYSFFDINVIGGKQDWTALHLAAHAGLFKTTQKLIKAGCDLFAANKMGKTARDVSKGNLALYKYLTGMEKVFLKQGLKDNQIETLPKGYEKNEYNGIYAAFKRRNPEKIREILENTQDIEGTVKADGVYLIGKIIEKHPKEYLKTCSKDSNELVAHEAFEALASIKFFEKLILSPKSVIGPRASMGSQVRKVSRRISEFYDD